MDHASTTFDSAAIAAGLSAGLAAHRTAFAERVAPPDERPMFTRAHDGAILDRDGRVLAPPPAKP